MLRRVVPMLILMLALLPVSTGAVSRDNRDEFTTGSDGWAPWSTATPGPNGANDFYLRIEADGVSSRGKVVTYNSQQWAGNYTSAGVLAIAFQANNLGASALSLRVAIGTASSPLNGGTWFASATAVPLAAGSGWQPVALSLDCGSLVAVQGTATCAQVLSGVATLRILSSAAPSAQGDQMVAVLGLDRITTVPAAPIFPSVAEAR